MTNVEDKEIYFAVPSDLVGTKPIDERLLADGVKSVLSTKVSTDSCEEI